MTAPSGSSSQQYSAAWPFAELSLNCEDLTLRPATDADGLELGSIVHNLLPTTQRYFMPRLMAAVGPTEAATARNVLRYLWLKRAQLSPAAWALPMAVLLDGKVVGFQGGHTDNFLVLRDVHTSSYLNPAVQGTGIGTRMRAMYVEFAFAHLDALTVSSGYARGNAASAGVSAKLGYQHDGIAIDSHEGLRHEVQRLRLTRERWPTFRPAWLDQMTVTGLAAALPLLGLR